MKARGGWEKVKGRWEKRGGSFCQEWASRGGTNGCPADDRHCALHSPRTIPVLAPGLSCCRLCKQCRQIHKCCLQLKPPQGFPVTPKWHCVMPKGPVHSTGLGGGEQQKRGPSVGVWGSATGVRGLRTLWKCTSYRRSHPSPDPHACEQEIKENCLRSDISCDVQLSSGILASRHV